MKLPFVPQICQLGIVKSTFELQLSATLGLWIVFFLGLKYLYKQQNNIILPLGLNFEFPMGNDRWKLNWLHLTVHLSNGDSVQLNTKIETETKFATLLLNDRKNWTLSQYWKLNFITNEYTNFPLSLQWGMTGENSINFV